MSIRLFLFLFSLLFSLFILNWLLYYPIVRAYKPYRRYRLILLLLLLILTLILVWGEVLKRVWNIYWLAGPGSIWLGFLSISATVMVINLLLMLFIPKFSRFTTTISLILIIILSVLSLRAGRALPVVREYDLYSEKISAASDGLKIILVSDFHLLSNSDIVWLEKTVALINDLNPDLVIIAGDLIDEPYNKIKHYANPFTYLKAPLGVFAVPGNHDYYHDIRSFYSFTAEAGIINLLNEHISINGDITIAGITDRTSKTNPPDVKKALNDVNPEDYLVFVSHQPLYYEEALERGADLILAGHTHRGQIPPLRFLIEFYFRYPYGLYEEKGSYLYTTSGVNTWGPPMRLFSHNEIIVFNLYSK